MSLESAFVTCVGAHHRRDQGRRAGKGGADRRGARGRVPRDEIVHVIQHQNLRTMAPGRRRLRACARRGAAGGQGRGPGAADASHRAAHRARLAEDVRQRADPAAAQRENATPHCYATYAQTRQAEAPGRAVGGPGSEGAARGRTAPPHRRTWRRPRSRASQSRPPLAPPRPQPPTPRAPSRRRRARPRRGAASGGAPVTLRTKFRPRERRATQRAQHRAGMRGRAGRAWGGRRSEALELLLKRLLRGRGR